MSFMPDVLSPLAIKIINANPRAYESLVVDSGTPAVARQMLAAVQPSQLLAHAADSPVAAHAMLAALWLWHDGLSECHKIVQQSSADMTSTFAFWHAIMHRREGDFPNSKHWYSRAASHPVLAIQVHLTGSNPNPTLADNSILRVIAGGWNPNALVDLVESVHRHPDDPRHILAVRLQKLEWQLLFDYCARP
jgi:hypothetical protein